MRIIIYNPFLMLSTSACEVKYRQISRYSTKNQRSFYRYFRILRFFYSNEHSVRSDIMKYVTLCASLSRHQDETSLLINRTKSNLQKSFTITITTSVIDAASFFQTQSEAIQLFLFLIQCNTVTKLLYSESVNSK